MYNPDKCATVQFNNVKRWLLATMVLILVLCILVVVVSPYIDLPLTTVRACIAAVFFCAGAPARQFSKAHAFVSRDEDVSIGRIASRMPITCSAPGTALLLSLLELLRF
jgi:phosphate/sulfate permease